MTDGGRTTKSAKNIASKFVYQILTMVLTLISRTVFIHVFGKEFLGMNSLFGDIMAWLSMADLGFGVALAYSFYRPLAENDTEKIAALMTFYKTIYNIIAAAIAVIGLCLTPFLGMIIKPEHPIEHMQLYYILSLGGIVVSYLCVYRTVIITADQKEYVVVKMNMAISIIKVLLQILVLAAWKNYTIYLAVGILCGLFGNIYQTAVAKKMYPYISKKTELDKKEKKSILSNIKSVFIYKVSSTLLNATDNTIISAMVGIAAVGEYSNYLTISNKMLGIFTMIFTSLTASIGNIIVKEKNEKRYQIFECEQFASFVLSGIVVPCFVSLINNIIYLWLGTDYMLDNTVGIIIGLNMYMTFVYQPLWSYREATAMYQKTKWTMLICAIINIVLSIALGKVMGLAGIILATFISKLCTYGWYEPVLLFRIYFKKNAGGYFKDMLLSFGFISVMTALLLTASGLWVATSWIMFIIKAGVFGSVSLIATLGLYGRNKNMKLILDKAKYLLGK